MDCDVQSVIKTRGRLFVTGEGGATRHDDQLRHFLKQVPLLSLPLFAIGTASAFAEGTLPGRWVTSQKGKAAGVGGTFLMNLAPHTGHSSQLFSGTHY